MKRYLLVLLLVTAVAALGQDQAPPQEQDSSQPPATAGSPYMCNGNYPNCATGGIPQTTPSPSPGPDQLPPVPVPPVVGQYPPGPDLSGLLILSRPYAGGRISFVGPTNPNPGTDLLVGSGIALGMLAVPELSTMGSALRAAWLTWGAKLVTKLACGDACNSIEEAGAEAVEKATRAPVSLTEFSDKDLLLGEFSHMPAFKIGGGMKGYFGKVGPGGGPDFILPQIRKVIADGGVVRFNLKGFSAVKAMDPKSMFYWGLAQNYTSKEFHTIMEHWDEVGDHILFYSESFEFPQ